MPQYNRRELDARAREYGFNRDTFEKVLLIPFIAAESFDIPKIHYTRLWACRMVTLHRERSLFAAPWAYA